MPNYVKFETPKELVPQILEMLSVAKDSGRVKKGINESTKAIERRTAQFVVLAEDVQPEEIVIHIPMLCEEKGIAYAYVPGKKELGSAVGIAVGTSCVAVENAGGASESLQGIVKKIPKQVSTGEGTTVAKPHTAPHVKPAEPPKHPHEHVKGTKEEEKETKPKTASHAAAHKKPKEEKKE